MKTRRPVYQKTATRYVHAAQHEVGDHVFPVPPLITNSACFLESVEHGRRMLTYAQETNIAYQRYANPTVDALEKKCATLEGAKHALAVNSGMTACNMVLRVLLRAGDHVVALRGLYHEISDQIIEDSERFNIEHTFVTNYDTASIAAACRVNTRMVFVESPTNPSLDDVDIQALATLCTSRGVLLVVDNSLLTFLLQKPLELGAHLCVYSTTKSVNGHGDAIGGVISTNDDELYMQLRSFRDNAGLIMDPFSAWLTFRGVRTLALRLHAQSKSALWLAERLRAQWPELEVRHPEWCQYSHRNEVVAGGCVFSIVLPTREHGTSLLGALRLFRIATTFGNLESLVYHFGSFARPSRDITKIGIPLGLVRLSIGIEDPEDLLADLQDALHATMHPTATCHAVG